ncbi:MAG: sensor histidine kinase [Thermoleophilaceae bacterium]
MSRNAARDAQPRLKLAAAGALGVALCALAVAITLSGPTASNAGLAAVARALMVGVPVAVGLYAWHERPDERFGPLLVALGFGLFLTTLAESGNEVVYSIGRASGWLVELGLVYLILAFPSGRLTGRADRALIWAAALLVATLYLPTVAIADSYQVPSPYTGCHAACPGNAFFVLGSEPSLVDSFVVPVREVLTALLFLAVTARLVQRFRTSTDLMRETLQPVLTVAAGRCVVLAVALGVREASPSSDAADGLVWAIALAVPLMAGAFFLGLVMRRLQAGNALQNLALRVRANLSPVELRLAVADALGDPSLRITFPNGGGRPKPRPGQDVIEVRDRGRPVAAIFYDEALSDERALLEAVASYTLIALKNQLLAAKVESSLAEVRDSRTRILASADRERRRIERDLHDGAQQRLVALRIQLELVEEQMERDPAGGMERLHGLGEDVGATLDEIRGLARGVYPALLEDGGIGKALQAAALKTTIAAHVEPDGIGRYPQAIESAVYFCCLEAIQNASKHASGATAITISLKQDRALRFQVRDDGEGFDHAASRSGAGLTNMRDRLGAIGGELDIRSSSAGTVVTGSIPLRPAASNGGRLRARWVRT